MAENNKIEKLTPADLDRIEKDLDDAVALCNPSELSKLTLLRQACSMAKGIDNLRKLFTPQVMAIFKPLQGSPLGFVTDKDKDEKGYDENTVRECLIQCFSSGLRPIGNEMNIIAGRMYAAKNGLKRLVEEWPGLSGLQIDLSVPVPAGDKGSYVSVRATWLLNGRKMSYIREKEETFDNRMPVRTNVGMGPDAIHGKAYRKTYFGILQMLTNNKLPFEDGDVIEVSGTEVKEQAQIPEGRRMKLGEAREPGQEG